MRRSIALPCLLSLLAACTSGQRTYVFRSSENGDWRIDARVKVVNGVADFECRHSFSGRCHYALFGDCEASASAACKGKVLQRFDLAVDSHQRFVGFGQRDLRLCVSERADQAQPVCNLDAAPKS